MCVGWGGTYYASRAGALFRAPVYVFDCTPARPYAPAGARRPRTFGDRVELLRRHIEEEGGVKEVRAILVR